MGRIKRVALGIAISLCSSGLFASNLLEIVEKAEKHDPDFQAAKHKYSSESEVYKQARARLMPTLSYQYRTKETDQTIVEADNTVFATGSETFKTVSTALTLNQPLFDWQIWSRFRQSKATVSRAEAEYRLAENELLLRVSEAYFLVLEMSDQLATAKDETQALQRHALLAARRKAAGLGRAVDVDTADARYLEAVAKEVEYESRLRDSRHALAALIGEFPEDLLRLSEAMVYQPAEPADVQEWVNLAKESSPKIMAREYAVEEAKQEINARRSGHYPTAQLTITDGSEDQEGSLFGGGSVVDTGEIVLSLNVPLFEGLYNSSRVRQAHQDHYRVLDELHSEQRQNEREVRDAFHRIYASVVQIDALRRSVEAQQRMLNLKTSGYQSGRYNILEVLDAQKDASNVQRAYTKSRYDYVLNTLRLKYTAGVITMDDVGRVNSWLISDEPVAEPQSEAAPSQVEHETVPPPDEPTDNSPAPDGSAA